MDTEKMFKTDIRMFLHLGWGYMFIVQWYLHRCKMAKYVGWLKGAMRECRSIVLVCGGKEMLTPLQRYSSTVDTQLLPHPSLQLYTASPKINVDLSTWTRCDKTRQTNVCDVYVLVHTSMPVLQVPQQCQNLKCLAWKKELDGTGIIFGCDVEGFIDMCSQHLLSSSPDTSLRHVITFLNNTKAFDKIWHDGLFYKLYELGIRGIDMAWPSENCGIPRLNAESRLQQDTQRQNAESSKNDRIKSKGSRHSKPPNIIVYCGKVNSKRHFQNVFDTLHSCVNNDFYAIYELHHDKVKTIPWQENTVLLVITCEVLTDGLAEIFSDFLQNGGNVMSFGSSLERRFVGVTQVHSGTLLAPFTILTKYENVSLIQGRFNYEDDERRQRDVSVEVVGREVTRQGGVGREVMRQGGAVLLRLSTSRCTTSNMGRAVFSQVYLHQDPAEAAVNTMMFDQLKRSNPARIEILQHLLSWLGVDCDQSGMDDRRLTHASLLVSHQKTKEMLLNSLRSRWKRGVVSSPGLDLQFVEEDLEEDLEVSSKHLPVRCSGLPRHRKYFREHLYWQHLHTECLGNTIIYTDVIPTTMALFDGLMFQIPDSIGLVAIAGRQTSGKGRGSNVWLSPEGCAMFSALVRMPLDSPLGRRVSFLQHLTILAVHHSITTLPGYQKVNVKLKWPNDLYYSDQMKLGGVIVNCTIMGSTVYAVIGCGFNVTNSNPTICVNDVIRQYNIEHGTNLAECSPEQLIARTLSHLETLIADFQTNGHHHFSELYYRAWLHSGQQVRLEGEGEVRIIGLDDFGYLRVQTLDTGRVISLQPDGNTFDMMHNLIRFKSSS